MNPDYALQAARAGIAHRLRDSLWETLRYKWPQLNDRTELCQIEQSSYSMRLVYPQEWHKVSMPPMHDAPGLRAYVWRVLGKALHRPAWVYKGRVRLSPGPIAQTLSYEIHLESFGLRVDNEEVYTRVGYDPLKDTLYISHIGVIRLPAHG